MPDAYTTIIGLEVHVQLSTASKLFCGCSTRFGAEPNTQTCPVCTGMPGSLPVMNQEAFRLALKTAIALNCEIPVYTKWDRKQYYYPDLPKGYQISQYDLPMSQHGYLEISDAKGRFATKRVRIRRAHLEEDAGKSLHDEISGKADSLIDLNRTGTPLLEIVSEPDLRSAAEAKAFLTELKLLLTYIGVSDCNMQEGSLRVDANVNLHLADANESQAATPIVEIKNMNSFRAVERALEYEAQRQYAVWQETGQRIGDVPKQTRGWDDEAGITRGQRSKEESSDYRYFPDPDLAPVKVAPAEVEAVRNSLGELPATLRNRLESEFGLSSYNADVLVNQGRAFVDYFFGAYNVAKDGTRVAAWVINDISRTLNENPGWKIDKFPIRPEVLGEMIALILGGSLPPARAAEVYLSLVQTGCNDINRTIKQLKVTQIGETELIEICRQVIAANPKSVADIKAGKAQAIGALIGQAKKINPNVDPNQVKDKCMVLIHSEP
jgi:aspartyl-tRNA(Asn)/glutamyl-tRNA(Gln) amidotransferase subunit B